MKKVFFYILFIATFISCSQEGIVYKPAEQILPQHIKSIAVRVFLNKTQQFGLEEKLTLKVINEFLKNGQYKIVSEDMADGIISGEITHYILTPIQYDSNMVATAYKINVILSVKLIDKKANVYLWEEPALQATKVYSAATLPGGMTEEQAREYLWDILSKDIVKRTVEGFGSATSTSEKKIPVISTTTQK